MHDITRLTRRLALTVLLCLLAAGITSAQSYQIQVRFTVRLRASYSLESPVVGKALAGDVLQVVDRYNRWLQIERDGVTAWLADWVEYTRLDREQTAPSEAAANQQGRSNIDNCCFVNRQCHSDREWVEGYWAYQRNECPAPPQPGSSAAPTSGHPITISGSYLFVEIITQSLDALRDRAPQWYAYATSHLNLIFERGSNRPSGHFRAAGTCGLGPYSTNPYLTHEWNIYHYVGSIVHYACHSAYRYAGSPYNGYTKVNEEADCVSKDNAAVDLVASNHPPGTFGSMVGISHCDGDLTNSPHCRWVRENCEWGPNMTLLACPAAGLITETSEEWHDRQRNSRLPNS
ncbi:MAG: SH3 domain-containing protein [Chloroflexi bacterium]|nr:SH3 domain-containing protein [Chloroflexota bacterium]